MTKQETLDAIENINSQIREFDYNGLYDCFSRKEVINLRIRKLDLEKQLKELEKNGKRH
jgi:hypothetical protein